MYCNDDPRDYDNNDNHADDDWTDMEYDDSLDGDHDSAMTSVGWGTDEDYGYYGNDDF